MRSALHDDRFLSAYLPGDQRHMHFSQSRFRAEGTQLGFAYQSPAKLQKSVRSTYLLITTTFAYLSTTSKPMLVSLLICCSIV